jgi:hypothetical protein
MINDYQFPVIACFSLFFGMISYWVSLALPKNTFSFTLGKRCVFFSNLLFALTLAVRWIGEGYFPLSNLYESLIFLSWGISSIHLFIESKTRPFWMPSNKKMHRPTRHRPGLAAPPGDSISEVPEIHDVGNSAMRLCLDPMATSNTGLTRLLRCVTS